ncbi:MAG TPA: cytochrome C oxidase subunit IV family protein [Woeseiaceae bacterium]|nr:cytochrome C oxidase subunit IV family protein [Woeseiaceae bacterium]|tara:strand:+ start:23106 stop:23465 length:360 start_codon:yes stop_codon:yes gene_type:complete
MASSEGQQHPLSIYYWVWGLLFVVSGFSYGVDYFQLQGSLRWTLILIFMFVKAGFITAIFMHMTWERLALQLTILLPPVLLMIFIGIMAIEGDYTFLTRIEFFTESDFVPVYHNSVTPH